MSITVVSPGFLTTVQDLGRFDYAHLGIPPSGAADPISLRLGNLLVSNPPDTAALEMTLVGGSFQFESGATIALTGSDFGATLDGQELPPWHTASVKTGQTLRCGQTRSGARGYLCIKGGVAVPRVLSSASTQLVTGVGGFQGRALRARDHLSVGGSGGTITLTPRRVRKETIEVFFANRPFGITTGPQRDSFVDDAEVLLCSSSYVVKEESNRMGLRLAGPHLNCSVQQDMVTEGVSLGALQVPPDGEPIILFVEHPTTGGYPKLANIISADLHRVGQLRPRDGVQFEMLTISAAVDRLVQQEAFLATQRCFEPI